MNWCRFGHSGIISFGLVRDERVFRVKGSPFGDYKIGAEHFALDSLTWHPPVIPPTF